MEPDWAEMGRLASIERWNQSRARLSARRESGAAMNRLDLTATAWRNTKTSSQSSAIVVNISAAAGFALLGFAFTSSASMATTLSLLLALYT